SLRHSDSVRGGFPAWMNRQDARDRVAADKSAQWFASQSLTLFRISPARDATGRRRTGQYRLPFALAAGWRRRATAGNDTALSAQSRPRAWKLLLGEQVDSR